MEKNLALCFTRKKTVFSLKRNRSVFRDIFENRYSKASIEDLSHCSVEVIEALQSYYKEIDDLYWYLKHTEDMPNKIEDEILRWCHRIEKKYEVLKLYVDAELAGQDTPNIHDKHQIKSNNQFDDFFQLKGEIAAVVESNEFLQPETFTTDWDQDINDTDLEKNK